MEPSLKGGRMKTLDKQRVLLVLNQKRRVQPTVEVWSFIALSVRFLAIP